MSTVCRRQAFNEKDKFIRMVPGVGLGTSQVLLSALPELEKLNRQEFTALVGVAPYCQDSGRKSGKRRIRGGQAECSFGTLYGSV